MIESGQVIFDEFGRTATVNFYGEGRVGVTFHNKSVVFTMDSAEKMVDIFSEFIEREGGTYGVVYSMQDVPQEVWDGVYEKWDRMLETGWDEGCWRGCGLCTWLSGIIGEIVYEIHCEELCPLYEDGWCRSFPALSRLHWRYEKELGSELAWRYRVGKFLEFIKPYCSREEDNENE